MASLHHRNAHATAQIVDIDAELAYWTTRLNEDTFQVVGASLTGTAVGVVTLLVGAMLALVRDALTLFDENAVLLQAPDELWDALIAREWTRLFVALRPLWAQARLVLFGHALTEKLVVPYKSITGHVVRDPVPLALEDDLAAWDAWLAGRLTAAGLGAKPFTPLPVLGVPGWWPANENPAYYEDATVFRPHRTAIASSP